MEAKTFLQTVLRGSGEWYCLSAISTAGKVIQKFFSSIDTLLEAADTFDAKGYNVYFGTATFMDSTSRKADNVASLASLYLDLDCGPDKEYPDQAAAVAALRAFCKALSLPTPLMVNSGRGVHVYWVLETPLAPAEWVPIALKLKAACAAHMFPTDPSVTADAARILRLPGSRNFKDNPPKPVMVYGVEAPPMVDAFEFSALLGADLTKPSSGALFGGTFGQGDTSLMDAIPDNVESNFRAIVEKTHRGKGCEQIRVIMTDQATCSEPMWRAGLSIAKHCVDSKIAAKFLSSQHPEYSEAATQAKLNEIKGPYRCATFDENRPGTCTKCPHWGKITSPIQLGKVIKEASDDDNVIMAPAASLPDAPVSKYVIPKYPFPFFRGATGGVYIRTRDDDGEVDEKLVYHNDLYVVKRMRDALDGECVVIRLHLPKDGVREFTIPLTAVTSKDELRKHLSRQGVAVLRVDPLMHYINTWINELQETTMADNAHQQFGWADREYSSFVLGSREIFADRIEFNHPSTKTAGLLPAMQPNGTLSKWKELMNFYNRPEFELHQFMVAASFGSVLVPMTAVNCATLHVYSKESGVGKTTAMYAAVSAWGDPNELVLTENDTQNTRMNRAEVYHNLPLCMDELTNASGKDLSDLAYQMSAGKQRGRLQSNGNMERQRGEPWRLLSITTGNASMIERISRYKQMPRAEAQRILEAKAVRIFTDSNSKQTTDDFSRDIMGNYGHAGVLFVQYVMNNADTVQDMLAKVQARVDAAAGLTAENRFWSVYVATTLTALIICNRIGLLQYDSKALFKWAIRLLVQNKESVGEMSDTVEELLNNYIAENYHGILHIKGDKDLRYGDSTAVVAEILPRGALVARYEPDTHKLFLLPKPLKQWCIDQQINYSSFVEGMISHMGLIRTKARIGKGTSLKLPPTSVLMLKFAVGGPPDPTIQLDDV